MFKNFDLQLLNEALFGGIDKMFKNGAANIKLTAVDLVSKFVIDRDSDPANTDGIIDIDFPSIKREDSEHEVSKAQELRRRCLFHFYKAMSVENVDVRLKAIDRLTIETSNPEQNYSLLIERLRDQDFAIRIAMIRKLRACRVHFLKLSREEICQAITYCMITRDTGTLG